MDEKKKRKYDDILNAGLAGAAAETVQRYGEAAKQHYVSYSGVDNETGTVLKKSLKQIADEKINPEYRFQNIQQQAGFSAEVKDVARSNAERIIKGSSARKIRTDDLGKVNDPLYDTVSIDNNGNIIKETGAQMKFLGASAKDPLGKNDAIRALEKLKTKKFEKYLDNDILIDVPENQYDQMIEEASSQLDGLTKQLKNQQNTGNVEQVEKIQLKINKLEKIKKNLRKSSLTSEEAVLARMHPELSTAIDITKISHKAGTRTAEISAIIGGSVSIVKNIVSVYKGEIDPDDAVVDVAKDTFSTAISGYSTGFVGSAVKGAMQNSQSQYVRILSETNVAGTIVSVSVSAVKTMKRYFEGEIDGVECMETLGEEGSGMLSAAMFSVIGQATIPIPVVGGLIGGMLGYAISSATYSILTQSLREEKYAYEQRIEIERVCTEHIRLIQRYRSEIEKIINEYLVSSMQIFLNSFKSMKDALAIDDVDWFIESANTITENFGGKAAFSDFEDFDSKMIKGHTFKL